MSAGAGEAWVGTVVQAEHLGSDTFVYVDVPGIGAVNARCTGELRAAPGDTVALLPDTAHLHRFDADQAYNVKLFDDVLTRSFAGPKSDALSSRSFMVHSWRYQLVGFVYRPKGESNCVLLVYRPNVEFVRMLRDQVVTE